MQQEKLSHHKNLALYFASKALFSNEIEQKAPNVRKVAEQPWQMTRAEMWDAVTDTICDLDFIQAKACAKMTYDLVNDFNEVLAAIPDNAENIRIEKERQARMQKYTNDLIAYAKGSLFGKRCMCLVLKQVFICMLITFDFCINEYFQEAFHLEVKLLQMVGIQSASCLVPGNSFTVNILIR